MVTIYEVAAKAGVSPATVSRVFNGLPVSSEKVDLVRAASDELRYVPNKTARRLRNQSSEVVALLIPDIENPFFTALARGVEDALQAAGYSLVLCNTDDMPAKETHYLDIANSENMAGVILAPVSEDGDIRRLTDSGRPVVAIDRQTGLDIDSVMVDNAAAGIAGTNALFDAGYGKVACIAGPLALEDTEGRVIGWRNVVTKRSGAAPASGYLQHANYRVDGGRIAMQALLALDDPPDAVIATNNLMAVGAIQVLSEAGMTPPDFGVAVVGDLPFTTLTPQAITQIHLPARHLGTTAATMLLERIAGDDQPARTVVLRAQITKSASPVASV